MARDMSEETFRLSLVFENDHRSNDEQKIRSRTFPDATTT
jgi:hypothetical protein